jgi:hypothetical protein
MSEEPKKGTKHQLAIAIGSGVPVAKWARANKVARSTAFRWANDPEVRKAATSYRRRVMDQAVGQMTKLSTRAVRTIAYLSDEGDSQAIRLKAARAVLSDMIAVSKYSGLEERMLEVEAMLEQPIGPANGEISNSGTTNLGYGTAPPPRP